MTNKRILMFTMGKWSHSNDAITGALHSKLPQYNIHVVDLLQEFKKTKHGLLACVQDIPVLLWQTLLDRSFNRSNILYAPATTRFINRIARKYTQRLRPEFTVQTTTRFNASTGLVPHFTVIDMTVAAGRQGYRDLYHSSERQLDRLQAYQQRVFSASDGVFAMGRYVRDSLVWDYQVAPHRAFTMGAGPNITLGKQSPLIGSQKILFVGTDWQRKGGPTLLEAFRRLRQKHPAATLDIVGCRPPISEPGVNVIGRVSPDYLHRRFTEARVFALPTMHEPFGIVFVEALHFGLPIVATNIDAIPEMVEDGINGCTVNPGDVDGLAYALDQILASDEIALAFGAASLQRAQHYTWEKAGAVLSENMLELVRVSQSGRKPGKSGGVSYGQGIINSVARNSRAT